MKGNGSTRVEAAGIMEKNNNNKFAHLQINKQIINIKVKYINDKKEKNK